MENNEKKYSFKITSVSKEKNLSEKIGNELINEAAKHHCAINFTLNRSDIIKYREFNESGSKEQFAAVLEYSSKYKPMVFVCPLYLKENVKYGGFIDLGLIPDLSIKSKIVADVTKIKFINKQNIIINDDMTVKNHGKISVYQFFNITECYKSLIDCLLVKSIALKNPINYIN